MKFDIPIIATVECDNIEEARHAVYKALQTVSFGKFCGGRKNEPTPIELDIANDEATDVENNRVYRLHPEDTHADFNVKEYLSKLAEQKKKV